MGMDGFEEDERHFLYREYLKIIVDHRPPVFIMENVKGLLSSKIHGKFVVQRIVDDLSSPVKAVTSEHRMGYDMSFTHLALPRLFKHEI